MWNRSLPITLLVGIAVPAIAQTSSSQYLVYVAAAEPAMELSRVRAIAPDAFVSQLSSGQRVIQVGRFNNLNLAQRRVNELTQSGLQADLQPVAPRLAPPPLATPPIASLPSPASTTTGVPIPIERLPNVPAPTGTFGSPEPPTAIEINRPISPTPLPPPQTAVISPPVNQNPSSAEEGRYVVIVPSNAPALLQRVRTLAPNAEIRGSSRGPYIEVRRYADRISAETLSNTLRQQGLDARVAYF